MAKDLNGELSRMKGLMNFGMTNESKHNSYNYLEYSNEGADGKFYGIVKEGTKYFIKEASKPKNGKKFIAEDFDYIGGWMNRKSNQYDSYSDCLKNFDLKMMSLAEANGKKKGIVIESLDPSKKENLVIEGTESMKNEIARQRQIMLNAGVISEGYKKATPISEDKVKECGFSCKPKVGDKNTIGDAAKATEGKDSKTEKEQYKSVKNDKIFNEKGEPVVKESSEVLGWNRSNPNYMDTTNGTEIGDGKPFDQKANNGKDNHSNDTTDETEMKNGIVEENVIKEDAAVAEPGFKGYRQIDKGLPDKAGMGKVGDSKPFDKKAKSVTEGIDECGDMTLEDTDIDDTIDDEADDMNADSPVDNDEIAQEDVDIDDTDEEPIDFEINTEDDNNEIDGNLTDKIDDILSRLDDLENKINGADFDDDSLYDDTDDDSDDDDEIDDDSDIDIDMNDDSDYDDDDSNEDSMDIDTDDYDEDNFKTESRRYMGKFINEDRLDDFGKHPSYRKKVMTLSQSQHQEKQDYNVWDENIPNDAPFGQQIGDGAPFNIKPQTIDNAISESINKVLGGKKK